MELGHNNHTNTYCIGCEQEALFTRQENDTMVTSCRNCGTVCITPYKPTYHKYGYTEADKSAQQ